MGATGTNGDEMLALIADKQVAPQYTVNNECSVLQDPGITEDIQCSCCHTQLSTKSIYDDNNLRIAEHAVPLFLALTFRSIYLTA